MHCSGGDDNIKILRLRSISKCFGKLASRVGHSGVPGKGKEMYCRIRLGGQGGPPGESATGRGLEEIRRELCGYLGRRQQLKHRL